MSRRNNLLFCSPSLRKHCFSLCIKETLIYNCSSVDFSPYKVYIWEEQLSPLLLSLTCTFSRTQTMETKLCIEELSLIFVIFEPVLNHHHIFRSVTGYFWSTEITAFPKLLCVQCVDSRLENHPARTTPKGVCKSFLVTLFTIKHQNTIWIHLGDEQ